MAAVLKMCHYIPCRKNMTAGDLAEAFIQEIVCLHGILTAIVSDQRSLFTLWFWVNMMYTLKIKRRLSTAFHPQTDGQTECQNSVLEQYLQSYVNYEQDDWASLLFLTEFTYNASKHSTTQKTPFEMVYEYTPRSNLLTVDKIVKYTAKQGSSAEAESLTDWLHTSCKEAQRSLIRAQEYQKKYYDKGWQDTMFEPGQKVWLCVKNIFIKRPSWKLDWLCYEPYRILEELGNQAYKLELPKTLNIHNVFHVSLFRAYKLCEGDEFPEPKPLCLAKDLDICEYEVSAILDSQVQTIPNEQPMLQYQIAWKGYTDPTWKPKVNVKNAWRLVNKFHKKNPDKLKPTSTKHTGTKVWLSFILTLTHKDYLSLALHRSAGSCKCSLLRVLAPWDPQEVRMLAKRTQQSPTE